MKIGIIGSCGHLGSALLRALGGRFSSAEIVAIDDLSTGSSLALAGLDSRLRVRFIQADVTSVDLRIELHDADVVVSLLPPIEQGGKFPAVEALARFLALRGIPLLHLSSTAVYGVPGSAEGESLLDQLQPTTATGRRALAVEARLRELGVDEKLHYATLRIAPLIGWSPAIHFRHEPLSWLWSAVCHEPPLVTPGILESSRPYLTVDDACTAVGRILEQERFDREPWNVYSGQCTGEQFFAVLRTRLPAIVHTVRGDEIRAPLSLSSLELSRKKLERIGVGLEGSPVVEYRSLVERFDAVLPRPAIVPELPTEPV